MFVIAHFIAHFVRILLPEQGGDMRIQLGVTDTV